MRVSGEKAETFRRMKEFRQMPFLKIGMMVSMEGDVGTVVSSNSSYNLQVVFANQLKHGRHEHSCHPAYKMKYFNEAGEEIASY